MIGLPAGPGTTATAFRVQETEKKLFSELRWEGTWGWGGGGCQQGEQAA